MSDTPEDHRSGFVTFVGRPNVGKSTLTNALVGEKVAITSDKPQTTRRAIRGILNRPAGQLVIVDTPGIRSFGLAHVDPDALIGHFPDLHELTLDCPRGCTHGDGEPECGLSEATGQQAERVRELDRQPGGDGQPLGEAEQPRAAAGEHDAGEPARAALRHEVVERAADLLDEGAAGALDGPLHGGGVVRARHAHEPGALLERLRLVDR